MITIKRLICPLLGRLAVNKIMFTSLSRYSFAQMSLFEQPKKPQQLSPVFKKKTRLPGHVKDKHRKGYISPKLNQTKANSTQLRLKNHRGLLKRIKIVGPRWNRQFKRLSAGAYHLKRKKSTQNLKRKSLTQYIHKADLWRVKRMIPYFKRKSLKNLY